MRLLCVAFSLMAFSSTPLLADEASVRQAIQKYVAAFNAEDLPTISSMWAEKAVHVDHQLGERTEGRSKIVADIKEVFEQPEQVLLSGTINHVRMVTETVASLDGQVIVTIGGTEPTVSQYAAIVVKNGEQWMIDSLEESDVPQPVSASAALSELDWLIGTWKDSTGDSPVRATVRRSLGGSFLIRSFEVATLTGETQQSTQIIGWDPRQQLIRSWTFDADGSFGEAEWEKIEGQWLISATQTLADGRMASGTYVMIPLNDDSFTVQLIAREIDGELQPASPMMTVQRSSFPPAAVDDIQKATAR